MKNKINLKNRINMKKKYPFGFDQCTTTKEVYDRRDKLTRILDGQDSTLYLGAINESYDRIAELRCSPELLCSAYKRRETAQDPTVSKMMADIMNGDKVDERIEDIASIFQDTDVQSKLGGFIASVIAALARGRRKEA